jgi:hypothetical protein
MGAREGRQEARVSVEDPAAEGVEHLRADETQVAREDHDVWARRLEDVPQDVVGPVGDQGDVDPLLRRPGEGGAGAVGDDEGDLAAQLAACGRCMQRPEVGAGAGDRDRDPAGGERLQRTGPSM